MAGDSAFRPVAEEAANPLSFAGSDRVRTLLDGLPAAVYLTDTEGSITAYNQAAADLAGQSPPLGTKWCVTWRLYRPDGSPLPLDQCPMAIALKERRAIRGTEIIAERPDGTRASVMPFPTPLYDSAGRFVGGVNMLVDLTDLKNTQQSLQRRMEEQAALYRFTDRLFRASGRDDVCDAALEAICKGLGCERASILLFDDDGIMRFVAWRGLSAGYRAAVEGHSPWTPSDAAPDPICIDDIDEVTLPDRIKAALYKERIAACAFIPLMAQHAVIGKFMAYYDRPTRLGADKVELGVTIARQLGFSFERMRSEEARRTAEENRLGNEERLRLATSTGRVGVWEWDITRDHIVWTDSLYSMLGVDRGSFPATLEAFAALVHEDDRDRVRAAIDRALEGSEPYEVELRCRTLDGAIVWLFTSGTVMREGGRPVRMLGATLDITERKQADAQRDLLVAELSHRVKNTLATVLSIAQLSFSRNAPLERVWASFNDRLRALARTHGRLAAESWAGVQVEDILRDELAPYDDEAVGNVRLQGPSLRLSPRATVVLGMAFHELATNAAKYGALSRREGKVRVSWAQDDSGSCRLDWVESGGPQVNQPSASGFGRLLLEKAVAVDLKGGVQLDFAPEGLRCSIRFTPE